VKVLRPEAATEEMLSRVSREASILSKLADRHVVPVLDVGHDLESDLAYLVMPLLSGVDASELLERVGVLAPAAAARIALQASSALVAAHAAGIAFRDLRPTKLFLENAPGGEIMVRVFGPGLREPDTDGLEIARSSTASSSRTATASRTGAAARSDRRADIFGLGSVLYQMLCGSPPRLAERTSEAGSRAHSRRIPPIQDAAPWVDAPLALALQPAITGELHRRYPSAEAFHEMLRAVTGGDEKLTQDMLGPLDASARAVVAPRADIDADPLVGHALGGRYKVLRLIGRGGMGGVYEVVASDGRRVAAKVIFRAVAGQDDQHMRRFIREARAATSIDSPHVVRTFELGTDLKLGSPFIVMEMLDGTDVARLLQEKGPMKPPEVVRIFAQAARGLAAAHKVGIVHRDVKPANLFLHTPGRDGKVVVKVCDFGVAKRSEDGATHDLTREGGVLGSPLYMSPEQAKTASHVDHRSDVWGLCVSLYQALCGIPPWDPNASLAELLLSICTERVPPLAQAAPWVPPELAAVVHKGLAREPEDRWQSMEALLAALTPHTGGTEELRLSDLVPVPLAEVKNAPPMESLREGPVRHHTGRRGNSLRPGVTDPDVVAARPPAPPSRASMLVVGGAAAVVVAGLLLLRNPPPSSAVDAVTYPVRAALQRATVRVPDGATVQVNGSPAAVRGGAIELSGEAGDAFEVNVRVGELERTVRVILTRDGPAEPDRIEVLPPPAAAASQAATAAAPVAAPPHLLPPPGPTASAHAPSGPLPLPSDLKPR
jgi:serine/threonine protein kinase